MDSVELFNCSDGNKTYGYKKSNYCGDIVEETTIVRTGGASDGTTGQSIKMVSSADTKEGFGCLALSSPPIHIWTTSAASQTVAVELVYDSLTALQNDEIWLEVEYPADNTSGLGAMASSQCVPLGTPANIPDSSEAWTTTGLSNPNTRKLTVTIDPGKAGQVTARVYLAKASTTVYVDPMITIT
jgi:hypothetical protein